MRREQEREPKVVRQFVYLVAQIRAQHVQGAVAEIDDVQKPEDDRQTRSDER